MTTATDYVSAHPNAASAGSAVDYEAIYDAEELAIIREMNSLDAQKAAHQLRLKTLRKLKAELKKKAEVSK